MKRLTIKLDEAHEKYAEIKKDFENCCKMKVNLIYSNNIFVVFVGFQKKKRFFQKKSLKPIPSLSIGERDFINTQVKVIQKWTTNLKTKAELIEEDLKILKLRQR